MLFGEIVILEVKKYEVLHYIGALYIVHDTSDKYAKEKAESYQKIAQDLCSKCDIEITGNYFRMAYC